MNKPRLLVALTVGFLGAMAALYFTALGDPSPQPPPPPPQSDVLAQSTQSASRARPKKGPPPPRITTPRFSTSGRSSSNLGLDDEGETWAPNEHRIEGRVLAERSEPVPGVRVTYRTDGKRRTTKTDKDGKFKITARGNKVTLQAERKDGLFTVRSKPVEVSGKGGEWEVDLVLEAVRHGGLGVNVAKHRDGLRIGNVVAGGPASAIGLTKGDIILEAGGTTIAGFNTQQASDLLIGPEGSTQTVLIRHRDGDEAVYTFVRQHLAK